MVGVLINLVLFQATWWSCVLGASNGLPWLGAVVALLPVGWYLAQRGNLLQRLGVLVRLSAVGCLLDVGFATLGWVGFDGQPLLGGLLPIWIVGLWLAFATTLDGCLAWLGGRPGLAAVMGLLAGPLAYLGAQQFGALQVADGWHVWLGLGVGWAVILPVLDLLAGARTQTTQAEVAHV